MIVHKFILLVFICLLVVYYNIFANIFFFDYLKIQSIDIIKSKENTNENLNKFVATLSNTNFCYIDIKNENLIKNIIYEMNEDKTTYYTTIYKKDYLKCSKPESLMEIIFHHLIFYYSLIMASIITIIINIYLDCILTSTQYILSTQSTQSTQSTDFEIIYSISFI